MKRLILAGALAIGTILPTTGCHSAVSGGVVAPPTITNTYSRAAVAMNDFSADVKQAQQIEISLYKGGVIAKPTHAAVQGGFLQVATYGTQIDALIRGQAGAATIQAKVAAALQAVQAITLTTGTLDANATAQLKATIQALTLILNNVTTILNTQTGELYGPGTDRNLGSASTVTRADHLPAVLSGTTVGWASR